MNSIPIVLTTKQNKPAFVIHFWFKISQCDQLAGNGRDILKVLLCCFFVLSDHAVECRAHDNVVYWFSWFVF